MCSRGSRQGCIGGKWNGRRDLRRKEECRKEDRQKEERRQ